MGTNLTNPQVESSTRALTRQEREFTNFRSLVCSDAFKAQIAMALPRHITPERLVRVVLTSVNKNPALLECTQASVMASIIESAQLGLMPDGILGEGYLIPYGDICQFQPGYRGLINLARRSGEVSNIYAELVFACDKFEITFGLDKTLIHEPNFEGEGRGTVDEDNQMPGLKGSYAVVKFKDGTTDFEYLPFTRMQALRASSKAKNSKKSPWNTPLAIPEMYRKMSIRALAKRLPLSPEFQRAAILDEYTEAGVDTKLVNEHIDPRSDLARLATENQMERMRDKYVSHKPEDESQENPHSATSSTSEASMSSPEMDQVRKEQEKLDRRRAEETRSSSDSMRPLGEGLDKGVKLDFKD